MKHTFVHLSLALVCLFLIGAQVDAVEYIQMDPLEQVITVSSGPVKAGAADKLPIITWGGDIATFLANGNSPSTKPGSIFAQQGLNFNIAWLDDFKKQVEMVISGDMWALRGTNGMINLATGACAKAGIELKVIYQMTWSTGGDCLVVKKHIKTLKDLKGKTIVLQAYGPHVDFLVLVLGSVGFTINDVNIKYVKDLTATDNTPVEAFYEDDVDAAFVIIPDGQLLSWHVGPRIANDI